MTDNPYYIVLGIILALFLIAVAVTSAFYRRASQDRAFVRTGLGGEKVVMDSGAFVLPVLHDIMQVNMQTLRVEITRNNKIALITKDPMRVDVIAEFYLRVERCPEAVAIAARTLGNRTMEPNMIKELVEAQCVAALRSAAATMTLDELHEKRTDFEHNVESTVTQQFKPNGMELVSVSLMRLDQTAREHFDETNAFDARGLIRLDEVTEGSKKQRNAIEQDNKIKIQERNKEAAQASLRIELEEIESQKKQALEVAELDTRTERDIEELKLQRDREMEELRIGKTVAIEMANRDMEVSRAEFMSHATEAWMHTDKLKAEAARLTEEISTAREKAEAERRKIVELISAQKEAQRQTIIAEANAEVERLAAKAAEIRYQVEAIGKSALNEASNLLGKEQISMQVKMEIVRQLPEIIRESVRPLENIDGIKIMHLDGLNAAAGSAGGGGSGGKNSQGGGANGGGNSGGLADQVVDSALRYRTQVPLIDALLNEVDLKADSSSGLTHFLKEQIETQPDNIKGDPESELLPGQIRDEQQVGNRGSGGSASSNNHSDGGDGGGA